MIGPVFAYLWPEAMGLEADIERGIKMKMSGEISYPATNKFEKFLIQENLMAMEGEEVYWNLPLTPGEVESGFNKTQNMAQVLHEMLGEYEHGQVDADVVLKMVGMEIEARTAKMYYKMGPSDPESSASIEFENETYEIVQQAMTKAMQILEGIYEDIILTAKAM